MLVHVSFVYVCMCVHVYVCMYMCMGECARKRNKTNNFMAKCFVQFETNVKTHVRDTVNTPASKKRKRELMRT